MTTLHETAEYLRRMGEPESSVDYLLAHRSVAPSLLEMFGSALDPRSLTMEKAVAVMRPAVDTGD